MAAENPGRLTLSEGRFGDLDQIAEANGFAPADGVVLDIGVSSMQIDDPARGFSFQKDGPLDMRMSASGPTAADVVNTAEEAYLADILYHLGEERSSRGIARAIVRRRAEAPFETTGELAALAARVLGREKIAGRHAATRTFQALRIYVNDELGELARGLAAAERVLAAGRPSGGRHLPFAGGWSHQAFPARAGVAGGARLAPPAAGSGSAQAAELPPRQSAPDQSDPGGDRRKPPRPLGKAAGSDSQRGAGLAGRQRRPGVSTPLRRRDEAGRDRPFDAPRRAQ